MSILTENQQRVLGVLSKIGILQNNFFLGGATALSEFYLQHRYSEDFDFFTSKHNIVFKTVENIEAAFKKNKIGYTIKKMYENSGEMIVKIGSDSIKLDLNLDRPNRVESIVFNEKYKIYIDNVIDMSCNKLSALLTRSDPKDFVDIYFIDNEIIKFEKLVPLAIKKHTALDKYILSQAMHNVKEIEFLPKMIKAVEIEELKEFFLKKAKLLMKQ